MVLIFTAICIALVALMSWLVYDADYCNRELPITGLVVAIILLLVCVGFIISLSDSVMKLGVIDEKIAMYEEENANIEARLAETVQKYQEYEAGIYAEVAPESSMTLVSLYPELKSDALVSKQIEVYVENNETIKSLKSAKINGDVCRWWLYFGG